LRAEHAERVAGAQERLREQKRVRKQIARALCGGPCTIPRLAEHIEMPAHEVLWHVAAMKKYGAVVEAGLDEDWEYYLYRLEGEVPS
jgi:hypothetical protein